MDLSIIIPTKDRGAILQSSLMSAILATQHVECEIIVVNDSKTSHPQISPEQNRIRIVDNPKSGVAAARNLGASLAKAGIIVFMDDDIQISKEVIDHTLHFYKHHPNTCINPDWRYPEDLIHQLKQKSFGRFMIDYNLVSFKGWYNSERWRDNELFSSELVASFFLPLTREQFIKSGGYNEQFPHAGFEDYDFPVRLRDQGNKLFIDTRICVLHNEEDRSDLKNWLNRQTRGAQTRRMGVELGYTELGIQYSGSKSLLFKILHFVKPFFTSLAKNFPNVRVLDFLFFRIVLLLQATCIFEGYHNKQA